MGLNRTFCLSILLAACALAPAAAEQSPEREGLLSAFAAATTPSRAEVGPSGLMAIVDREAAALGIPVALARAVVRIESRWNPRVTGRAGEVGLFQIKHASARAMGFTGSRGELYDPAINARYGMKYLAEAWRLAGGDLCRTIVKYQGGHYATHMTSAASTYCSKVRAIMASR